MRRMPTLIAHKIIFLDPGKAGSTIGWTIQRSTFRGKKAKARGTVNLSDCNRMIEWSFGSYDNSIPKIEAAIASLIEFRDTLKRALK